MRRIITIPLLLFTLLMFSQEVTMERPNILLVFADDWGKYASCYSKVENAPVWQNIIKTPNIDRIANEGVLFNNAFVSAPSCTPSRSAVLSGQHFYRTGRGAILHGSFWDESIPTYPLILEKAGYHIGFTYKVWHPITAWNPNVIRDLAYGGEKNKYNNAGKKYCTFSQTATELVALGKTVNQAKQILLNEVRQNFSSFLKANVNDSPFCYWFGPTNTHRFWASGSGCALWGINPESLKGNLPSFLPDVSTVRQDFADYLGEVMALDAAIGELIKILEEKGILENTLIMVTGDHGIPGFTHGKCNLYDFGTNVAMAARWPAVIQPNRVVDDFVNLMDLAPTFLDVAGVESPQVMTGKSLVPILKSQQAGLVDKERNFVVTGRERHCATARTGNLPYPQRALRTSDFLYILNFEPNRYPSGDPAKTLDDTTLDFKELSTYTRMIFGDYDASPTKAWIIKNKKKLDNDIYYRFAFGKRPREELYNIKSDPFQVNNIAGNIEYHKIKLDMRNQLLSELKNTGDPRVCGDGSTFEKPPYAGGSFFINDPQRKALYRK